ncbi:helix-turn-helix transcriptional regulator [Methylophilus sp.]|uniref:helix-turn-helix domain-containing protein n=1 Tax=Methylophilus sp. TaxID=29541 RepID=UPI0025FF6EE0|nr:helix-turn-helix transcriptional regulator [Methylophilus sp.]
MAKAIKEIRLSKELTQEFFSDISSRTYMSVLENGKKRPSVEKVDSLANAIGVHPLTILTLSYLIANEELKLDDLQKKIYDELKEINRT